ncbi:MAG: DUF4091 domain-containing protein [Candidatus Sericytochromatia bacterium]
MREGRPQLELVFERFSSRERRFAAVLEPDVRDWSQAGFLVLGLSNPAQDSLYLGLRVEDEDGRAAVWHELIGVGQRQEVLVPLAELVPETKTDVKPDPAEGRVDLSRIRRLELFIRQPKLFEQDPAHPVRLWLDTLALGQRSLSIAAPRLTPTPGMPRRLLLQTRSPLAADWELRIDDGRRTVFQEGFLRAREPRWMVALPAGGPYRVRLQASRGAQTAVRELSLDLPATAGPTLQFWIQPGSSRPDHYLIAPAALAPAPSLQLLGAESEGLLIPLLAAEALNLKAQAVCPGLRCRLYRVGWLQAWQPENLYRLGQPGWIADALLPVSSGFSPLPGQIEALYLEVSAAEPAVSGHVDLDLDWGSGRRQVQIPVSILPWPNWRSYLPRTAFSLYPEYLDRAYGPAAAWRWSEAAVLLGEHHLHLTNLYQPPRSPQQIDTLLQLGQLPTSPGSWFNLGYLGPGLLAARLPALKAAYAHLAARQALDKAYVFAFDEFQGPPQEFAQVLEVLERELPGLPVISTARLFAPQAQFSPNLHWSPSLRDFELYGSISRADWGYVFVAQRPPYPNFFLESDLIEARLIPWMAWREQLDGLLYYTLNRWSNSRLIAAADFPLLNWKPNCFEDTNGDGCLIYPGAEGILPSLRLKNLQQGLEDWALLRILEARLGRERLQRSIAPVVAGTAHFSHDPAVLAARVTALKALLTETAGGVDALR